MVNDLGGARTGEGSDAGPAQAVVDEITAAGGKAAANTDDISSWAGAEAVVNQAVDDVRRARRPRQQRRHPARQDELQHDRGRVGLGHQGPPQGSLRTVRFAAAYWRQKSKDDRRAGERQDRQHRVRVGPVRQRRPGELRGGEGRDRGDDDRARTRARALRRARATRSRRSRSPASPRTSWASGPMPTKRRRRRSTRRTSRRRVGWLASDLSDGVTGQVVKIQGGVCQIVQGWRPVTADHERQAVDDRVDRRGTRRRCSRSRTPASRRSCLHDAEVTGRAVSRGVTRSSRFRDELRAFLDEHAPPRGPGAASTSPTPAPRSAPSSSRDGRATGRRRCSTTAG